jgi:hypothetical protein
MSNSTNLPMTIIKQKKIYDLKKLRIELNKVQIKREEIDTKIGTCLKSLETEHSKYGRKCTDLENEIHILNAKIQDYLHKHDGENKSQFHREQEKPQKKPKADPELESKCKELYKAISMLTHPDVAKNEDLIPLFTEAKEAYERLDYLELIKILDNVSSPQNIAEKIEEVSEEELKAEYDLLANELQNERNKFDDMIRSVQYKIYSLTDSECDIDNMVGEKLFIDVIMAKIIQLKRKRDGLEKEDKVG